MPPGKVDVTISIENRSYVRYRINPGLRSSRTEQVEMKKLHEYLKYPPSAEMARVGAVETRPRPGTFCRKPFTSRASAATTERRRRIAVGSFQLVGLFRSDN
jgi:hypothetical protein